jgi:hypothetical protein
MYFTLAIVQAFPRFMLVEDAGRFGVPHRVLSPAR